MMQIEFVTELFALAHDNGINTCLDTSGIMFRPDDTEKTDKLLSFTDLVMLDIKHIDNDEHKKLTGQSNENILEFAKYLDKKGVSVWIRHVGVPGITLKEDALLRLGEFIGTLSNVKKTEVLPYHSLGKYKYEKLGIPYPMGEVLSPTETEIEKAKKILFGTR